MRSSSIRIGGRAVGLQCPVYFIADIGANHDGSLLRAKGLIHACAAAGADAVKFQHFRADSIVSDVGFRRLGQQAHQATWRNTVCDTYKAAALPLEWTQALLDTCAQAGVEYMTTPYAYDVADHQAPHVRAWKVGSGDITWLSFIDRLARDGKPMLLGTGAAQMWEVERAVAVVQRHGTDLVVMQCNTNYSGGSANFPYLALNVLKLYEERFPGVVLGLSDHTPGHAAVLGAVALGARVIEKHFTDDVGRDGPDHSFAMEPGAWREMVDRTRELEAALGPREKRVMENEHAAAVVQRRALRAARALDAGTVLTQADVVALRPCPADGLPPYALDQIVGRRLRVGVEPGDLLQRELCDG